MRSPPYSYLYYATPEWASKEGIVEGRPLEYCPTDSTCGDVRGLKVRIVVDGRDRLVPWEIAVLQYPMSEAALELAALELEAVGLPFGYEPDLEIQQLISESLGEYSTLTVVDLDDIYD